MSAPIAVTSNPYHKNIPLKAAVPESWSEDQKVAFQKALDTPTTDGSQQYGEDEKDKEPLLSTTGQPSKDDASTWNALQKAMVNNIVQDGNRQASNFRMRLKETYNEASQPLPQKKH